MSIEELDTILQTLEERMETHPNICKLWVKYINIKKNKLEQILNSAKTVIESLDTTEDMTSESLMFLLLFIQSMRETA